LELVTETSSVVALALISDIFFYSILVVRNVLSSLVPPAAIFEVSFLLRINCDLHAVVKQRIWLCEIHQVKSDTHVFPRVFYLKKEPLSMAAGVDIILHK
jgi:hypothetical protein